MRHRNRVVAAVALLVVAAGVVIALVGVGGVGGLLREREGERDADRPNGYFEPRKEAKFERAHGGGADRKGPDNPAAEQVENRAYPLSYVDDKRAAAARKNFEERPGKADRTGFDTTAAFNEATAAAPGAWSALGPVTANVPGEASQVL